MKVSFQNTTKKTFIQIAALGITGHAAIFSFEN